MRLVRVSYGARNQASAESETTSKIPKTKNVFGGVKSNQTRMSLSPSYIQTILSALESHQVMLWSQEARVPDRVCFRNLQEQALALHRLVGFTTDREFTCITCQVSPCPEG